MAQELKQELRLAQKLVLTPQLQQAIKLLQLTRMELAEHVNQELSENPVLEETIETAEPESESESDPIIDAILADEGWTSSYNAPTGTGGFTDSDEKQSFIENTYTGKTSLLDHIIWQIQMSNLDEDEAEICAVIAGNLDDTGYLMLSVDEIATKVGKETEDITRSLKRIQHMDPIGIGARDLPECLTIQAEYFSLATPTVLEIINKYLSKLQNKNYTYIARKLGVSTQEVIDAVDIITNLEPKPGRLFTTDECHYIIPDIYIYKIDDEYVISLNENGLPRLRISSFYRKLLKEGQEIPTKTKDFIKERIRSATWLIRSIHQRQRTIYNVTKSIVSHQREFLDNGIDFLKPLILKDIAEDIGVHESTVSRVTNGKYVHTPRGVFELKFFFTGRVNSHGISDKSVESTKNRIKEIIAGENPKSPVSDQKIVEILKEEGVFIARRTVAKYRETMGILSSSRRKEY
jgi:RNA polymerase sigma-54 factor